MTALAVVVILNPEGQTTLQLLYPDDEAANKRSCCIDSFTLMRQGVSWIVSMSHWGAETPQHRVFVWCLIVRNSISECQECCGKPSTLWAQTSLSRITCSWALLFETAAIRPGYKKVVPYLLFCLPGGVTKKPWFRHSCHLFSDSTFDADTAGCCCSPP